ncbi:MAG TPA: flippase [Puia sp.]|nr:flippase [Puia sp.]
MIKRNLIYNSLLSVSQILFPLIIFPYTFKILEPPGIGLVSFADSLTQYLISFAAIGIPVYGVIETAKVRHDPARLARLFSELVLIQLVISLFITVVFIGLIFTVEKLAEHKLLYFLSCGTLLMNAFTVEWFFQGIERFKYITMRTISVRFLFLIAVFVLVKKKEDLLLYYGLTFISAFLNGVINFSYARREVRLEFTGLSCMRHMRPLLHIFFSNVAISVYILLDTVILGFLADDTAVGYYATAIKICKIPLAFMTALSTALIPRISASLSSGNREYVQNLIQKSFAYIILISLPIGAGLLLLAPELITVLANRNYLPAIPVVRTMAPLTLIIGLSNLFGIQILTSMGKEKLTLYAVTLGMILSVVCNLILIPRFSYMGTAYTTLLTEGLVTIVTGWYALRHFRVALPYNILWQSGLACLLFYPCYYLAGLLVAEGLLRMLLVISMAATVYFCTQYFVFRNIFVKQTIADLLTKVRYG